jgi:hypothetical protein
MAQCSGQADPQVQRYLVGQTSSRVLPTFSPLAEERRPARPQPLFNNRCPVYSCRVPHEHFNSVQCYGVVDWL